MNTDTTFVVRRIPVKAIFKLHKKNGHTDIANKLCGDFPGGSVAKSLRFKCRGTSLIPSGETGICRMAWPKRKTNLWLPRRKRDEG